MNDQQKALISRWDAFLAKIEQRHDSLIDEARQGVSDMMASGEPDPMAVDRALHAIGIRLQNLRGKISDAWTDKVLDQFSGLGIPGFDDVGIDRAEDMQGELEEQWDDFRVRATADVYRSLYPAAMAALEQPDLCGTCGSPVHSENRRRTMAVTCGSCGAVNQVAPPKAVLTYAGAAGAYAAEAAMPIRIEIERQRRQADRISRHNGYAPEPIESLEAWAALEQRYWETYAAVETEHGDVGENHAAELVASRMAAFEEYTIKTDQRWRRHRGL